MYASEHIVFEQKFIFMKPLLGIKMLRNISNFKNCFLSNISDEIKSRWLPHLEQVYVTSGESIYETGRKLNYVYFPESCIISVINHLENGDLTEVAVKGYEGMVGVSQILGDEKNTNSAIVQSSGIAYRIRADFVKKDFIENISFRKLFLLYMQSLITQMTQKVVCNRFHSIEEQLCRWLLSILDRLAGTDLVVTHEFIANMLGVRREGVTEAAGRLQRDGVIKYARGKLKVLDRKSLANRCCECHAVVHNEYKRLFPQFVSLSIS